MKKFFIHIMKLLLFIDLSCIGCGVKGPPLPPLPSTPQEMERLERHPLPSPLPTPSHTPSP